MQIYIYTCIYTCMQTYTIYIYVHIHWQSGRPLCLSWGPKVLELIHIVSWARQICAEQKDIQRIDRLWHYEKLTCICFHCLLLDLLIHPVVNVNKKNKMKQITVFHGYSSTISIAICQ